MGCTGRVFTVATLLTAGACSSSDRTSPPAVPVPDDGGEPPPATPPVEAGAPITVRSYAPASATGTPAAANATWTAYLAEGGVWTHVAPSALGTYVFPTTGEAWSVALVCADDESSLVAIYERPSSTTELDAILERWCGPPAPDVFTLAGHLTNVPSTTAWLDFAYGLESRGAALPVTGTSAEYEEVNVTSGTWDLMFGVRDDSTEPLSKIALVRGHVLAADATLDVDLAGPAALATSTRPLVLRGVDAAESVSAPVYYATGGAAHGLDLGRSLPSPTPDIVSTYATVPPAAQAAADRYRLELLVALGDAEARGTTASFHEAMDVDLAVPEPLAPPTISVVASAPHLRVSATVATRAAADLYEVETAVRVSGRARRAWRVSTLVPSATMPEIAAAAGFDPAWALPDEGDVVTTVKVYEKGEPFGDGTVRRWASRAVDVLR